MNHQTNASCVHRDSICNVFPRLPPSSPSSRINRPLLPLDPPQSIKLSTSNVVFTFPSAPFPNLYSFPMYLLAQLGTFYTSSFSLLHPSSPSIFSLSPSPSQGIIINIFSLLSLSTPPLFSLPYLSENNNPPPSPNPAHLFSFSSVSQ